MRPAMTMAEIARAVRAGFVQGGADPAANTALIGKIVADVAQALQPGLSAGPTPFETAA